MILSKSLKLLMILSLVCVTLIGVGGFRTKGMFNLSQSDISNARLQGIKITGKDLSDEGRWRLFQKNPSDLVKFEMGLDNLYENVRIRLTPKPEDTREFKIEQQIETSLMINDEGLPLYLLDWKHGRSTWVELTSPQRHVFSGNPITFKDEDRFPDYTKEELYQAIVEQEKINATLYEGLYSQNEERWLNVAKQKPEGGNMPYSPGVSTIRFRIKAKEGDTWQVVHTVEILVAFGC
ncbi:MAG: hypothetical protein HY774_10910 [Acidobacteria bacterium]|nr:hypothetical protein [Acidobacteriota bacterium]